LGAGLVATSTELGALALRHGLARKRYNALAAVLSGGIPAALFAHYYPSTWAQWLLGLAVGLLWGNGFEYAYHRWLLHLPGSSLGKGHLEHHASVGTPGEAEHVALGRSPLYVALLFASNGLIVVLIDFFFALHILPGIFVGWVVYLVTAEEIHWRIHMNGWLPPSLRFARAYHMHHHDTPDSRYNVFMPIFDLMLGSCKPSR